MNLNIELVRLVQAFLFGYCTTILIIIYLYNKFDNKMFCQICKKEIWKKGVFERPPNIFYRNGKVIYVHQGQCANKFLYGDIIK